MHFTALLWLSRNGWLWGQRRNILHFEFKNTLASHWVFGELWLVGEDKQILHIVYHLQLPAACSTAGLGEGKVSSASSLAWCLVVCAVVLGFALFSFLFSIFTLLWAALKSVKKERRYQQQRALSFWLRWSRFFQSTPKAWGVLVTQTAIFPSKGISPKIWQDWAIGQEKKGRNFYQGNYGGVGDPAIIVEADVREKTTCPEWLWKGEKTSKCCLLKEVFSPCSPPWAMILEGSWHVKRKLPLVMQGFLWLAVALAPLGDQVAGWFFLTTISGFKLVEATESERSLGTWSGHFWHTTCFCCTLHVIAGKQGKNSRELSLLHQGTCWYVVMCSHAN